MHLDHRDADVAIIGSGFAGLACARAAAARGLRTVVFDRKHEAGQAPHTTGLLVKEIAEEWDVPPRLSKTITGVRLYGPSLRSLDLESPGYYFLATDTSGLLRWLARQALSCGAELRYGAPWRGAAPTGDGLRLHGHGVIARHLVAADGARSAVAADLGLGRNTEFLTGVEAELHGVRGVTPDRLHCLLDSELAPGYLSWVIPGVGVTQVGVACRQPARPDLRATLDRWARVFDFDRATIVERRGGLIPVGGPVHPMASGRTILIGDAAGLVSPLTAGGIHLALAGGRRVGLAIAAHVLAGGPSPARAVADLSRRFRWKLRLRHAFDRTPPNALIDWTLDSTPLRALARLVFFHHRGLREAGAWRSVATAMRTHATGPVPAEPRVAGD